MGIGLKLLLAGLSGFLVMIVWITFSYVDSVMGAVALYGFSGSLFAAGVLLPYLKHQDLISWRSAALVLISGVSFYCAVFAANKWSGMWGPNTLDFVIASLSGAAIVLLASPFILNLRFSVKYAVVGTLSALVGGSGTGGGNVTPTTRSQLAKSEPHAHTVSPVPAPRSRPPVDSFEAHVVLPLDEDELAHL